MAAAEADVFRRPLHETSGVTGLEQVGTVDDGAVLDRRAFAAALDRFAAVVDRRVETLLQLPRRPRTPADVVAPRLVHRPHVRLPFVEAVEAVERRTALLHLQRLARHGRGVPAGDGYAAG